MTFLLPSLFTNAQYLSPLIEHALFSFESVFGIKHSSFVSSVDDRMFCSAREVIKGHLGELGPDEKPATGEYADHQTKKLDRVLMRTHMDAYLILEF
jgi:hypothetical protein